MGAITCTITVSGIMREDFVHLVAIALELHIFNWTGAMRIT